MVSFMLYVFDYNKKIKHDLFEPYLLPLLWDKNLSLQCILALDKTWDLNGQLHNSNNRLYSRIPLTCGNGIVFKLNSAQLWHNNLQITKARTYEQCDDG